MASIKRIGKDGNGVPIWNVYYRRAGGKPVNRHIHAATRADVEREIALDSGRSGVSLRWSEGVRIYLDAKRLEDCNPVALGHVERALAVFVELIGDMAIEKTDAATFKDFMQRVIARRVRHPKTGRLGRASGPGVANHHRKELLTVARYLRAHTGLVKVLPFEHVPRLPVREKERRPIPRDRINEYVDALDPHVRRPVLMVLVYGLRSTAVCNILLADCAGGEVRAMDKMDVERRIPIDDFLAGIVKDAVKHRDSFSGSPDGNLFVNTKGRAWNYNTLLRAAQRCWKRAGLEKKKIHEVRHTLGTLAGKYFSRGMVQAAMGHRSEKSSARYFHPDEEMAAEVREKLLADFLQKPGKSDSEPVFAIPRREVEKGETACPHCKAKLLFPKD